MPISQKRLAKVCQKVIRGVQLFGFNPRTANLAAEMVDMQKWQVVADMAQTISVSFFSGSDRLSGPLRGLQVSDSYGILP